MLKDKGRSKKDHRSINEKFGLFLLAGTLEFDFGRAMERFEKEGCIYALDWKKNFIPSAWNWMFLRGAPCPVRQFMKPSVISLRNKKIHSAIALWIF
jgi:hypothetical protein